MHKIAKGLDVINKGEDDEAVNYFVDILPRIKRKWGHVHKIIEFTQMPGDTVFVPGGWWHAVINIENSVAITQVRICEVVEKCTSHILSNLLLDRTIVAVKTLTACG